MLFRSEISKHFPTSEQFGMVSQLRRAAVSIASNIAEGTSRESNKEKIRFVEIAYGSLLESYCQLQLSCDLGYLSEEVFERMKLLVFKIGNMLGALKRSYKV